MSHKSPSLAVDVVVFNHEYTHVLLIERKNNPLGLALPGGFVEVGETTEHAGARELLEETGIYVSEHDLKLSGVYSKPDRDPRGHVISIAYFTVIGDHHTSAKFTPKAGDDAKEAKWVKFGFHAVPTLVFDHSDILRHAYFKVQKFRTLDNSKTT